MEKITMRKKLVEAILDFASDEFETPSDFIDLCKMSEEELVDELINITEYFRDRD